VGTNSEWIPRTLRKDLRFICDRDHMVAISNVLRRLNTDISFRPEIDNGEKFEYIHLQIDRYGDKHFFLDASKIESAITVPTREVVYEIIKFFDLEITVDEFCQRMVEYIL